MSKPTDIMATRFTAKKYDPARRIADEDLKALLEAARLSPTSVNAQLTRFWVADTPEAIEKLMPGLMDFNRERVQSASALIVLGVLAPSELEPHLARVREKEVADGRAADEKFAAIVDNSRRHFLALYRDSPEKYYAWATHQAYIGLGLLMVLSAQMGINSTPLEGIDFEVLSGITQESQPTWRPVVALALGYCAEDDSNAARPKSRLDFDEVIQFLK